MIWIMTVGFIIVFVFFIWAASDAVEQQDRADGLQVDLDRLIDQYDEETEEYQKTIKSLRSTLEDIRDQNVNDPNYNIWARTRAAFILQWTKDE